MNSTFYELPGDVSTITDVLNSMLVIQDKIDFLINLVFVFVVIYSLINVIRYFYVLLHGFTKL